MQLVLNELKALREENKTLTASIATIQSEKITDRRMETLTNLLKNVPEETRTRYLRDYGFMSFDTDDKFNSYIDAIKPEIEKIETETKQAEGQVGGTKGAAPLLHHRARYQRRCRLVLTIRRPSRKPRPSMGFQLPNSKSKWK